MCDNYNKQVEEKEDEEEKGKGTTSHKDSSAPVGVHQRPRLLLCDEMVVGVVNKTREEQYKERLAIKEAAIGKDLKEKNTILEDNLKKIVTDGKTNNELTNGEEEENHVQQEREREERRTLIARVQQEREKRRTLIAYVPTQEEENVTSFEHNAIREGEDFQRMTDVTPLEQNIIREEEDSQRQTDVNTFLTEEDERERERGTTREKIKRDERKTLIAKYNKEEEETNQKITVLQERMGNFRALRHHLVEQARYIALLNKGQMGPGSCGDRVLTQTDKRIKAISARQSVLRDRLHVYVMDLEAIQWLTSEL
jgi:hypothetical protein